MYCADDTVTVVQFDRRTQKYSCQLIHGVSWHTVSRRHLQTTDASQSMETTVRIPEKNMPAGLIIRANDIVCHGVVQGEITRRADLEIYERFVVSEVHDNRRGKHLRHWAVIGA